MALNFGFYFVMGGGWGKGLGVGVGTVRAEDSYVHPEDIYIFFCSLCPYYTLFEEGEELGLLAHLLHILWISIFSLDVYSSALSSFFPLLCSHSSGLSRYISFFFFVFAPCVFTEYSMQCIASHLGNFMVTYSYIILPFIKYIAYSMPGDLAVSMSLYLSEYAKKCKCIFACVDTDREIIR